MPLNKNIHVMHKILHLVSVGLLMPTKIILILLLYHQGTHTSTYTHEIHWKWLKSQSECMDTTCEYCYTVLRLQLHQVPNTSA